MKESANKQNASLTDQLQHLLAVLGRYVPLLFLVLLACVYGFVAWQIAAAHDAQPTSAQIAAKLQSVAAPHIDQKTVDEMQSLQDHSVNVKTLFDQARSNPFQE